MSEYTIALKRAKKAQAAVDSIEKDLTTDERLLKYLGDCLYAIAAKGQNQTSPQVKQMTDALSEVRKTAEVIDKPPPKKVRNFKNEVSEVDPSTGEILEKDPGVPRGFMHTDDCPKNQDLCKISERDASLSQIRFRQVLCQECFKAHE